MQPNQKIILLTNFELGVDANIAKTKLDAYGIPCFLTNENMAYPLPSNPALGGVQLMIFENDKERAEEILNPEE